MLESPYKLQLTRGFFVDFDQIARILTYAIEHQGEGRIPSAAYATSTGTSSRRAKDLCSLATAFVLIHPIVFTSTRLGSIIHRYDPFLDNLGTLWLLHYLISSNERYVVWNRLVNRVIPENERFSTAIARPYFDDLSRFYSESSVKEHLRKEMGVVWNAYTAQSFRHLNYICAESDQVYVRGTPEPVPPQVFCAAVLSYRDRFAPGSTTIDISLLAKAPNSPGRVFGLTGRQVRDLLEECERQGYLYVETRADLDQVRFRDDLDFLDVVRLYYEGR